MGESNMASSLVDGGATKKMRRLRKEEMISSLWDMLNFRYRCWAEGWLYTSMMLRRKVWITDSRLSLSALGRLAHTVPEVEEQERAQRNR